MLASYKWLKELSGVDATPEEMAAKLTAAGLEVEELIHFPTSEGVVVAEVKSIRPHPSKDRLRLVTVDHGQGEQEVVCGAPNVPDPGGKVLLAKLGAALPPAEPGGEPFVIAERPVGGVPSAGMLCSESELALGEGGEGIYVFGPGAPAAGTPLEEVIALGDTVFEIGLTPNRPDCLGHIGIARDLAAMFQVPMPALNAGLPSSFAEGVRAVTGEENLAPLSWGSSDKAMEVALEETPSGPLGVTIADGERCPRYGAAMVLGVSVGPSPLWLRYRLHCLGVRSISNLVDATNLVMLETGHPIHGFDYDKLRGHRIEVRTAGAGETLTTLDEIERKLVEDDLLICDGEGPIALAGVMGGQNSEIGDDTKNVAIECAYFDPRSVRRTSRRLGLHTDASHRFERGVDPNDVPFVLARAAALMATLGRGVALAESIDVVANAIAPATITLNHQAVERLLGVSVPADVPARVLTALGAGVEKVEEGTLSVTAPTWRPDLGREADLIEEIARIWGYEHIPSVVPKVRASADGTSGRLLFERALRNAATGAGLNEAINYAFVSEAELAKVAVPAATVRVANPLSEERAVMRTSLLPGLVGAAVHAIRRQASEVALFEIGRVFKKSEGVLPEEQTRFGVILAGRHTDPGFSVRDVDFFDLKGALEGTLADLGTVEMRVDESPPAFLHPRRCATVWIGETQVGVAGELHPDVRDAVGLDDRRGVFAELCVATLDGIRAAQGAPQAPHLPRFPFVSRDIALLLDKAQPAASVAQEIAAASSMVERVELFDVFEGDSLPEGKRSLAFHIVYRDAEKTLTDKKVDKEHQKLVRGVTKALEAEVR